MNVDWWPRRKLSGLPPLAALAIFELGEFSHTVANCRPRQAQLIKLLQIEPKYRAGAEPVAQSQRRIGLVARFKMLTRVNRGTHDFVSE
jgi:hypothetical protein